jgi:hypothetical protein
MRFLKSLAYLFCFLSALPVLPAAAQDSHVVETSTVLDTTVADAGASSTFLFDTVSGPTAMEARERIIPDTVLQRLRSDEAFWYANADIKKESSVKQEGSRWRLQGWFAQEWFRGLLWAIIISAFAAVLFLFLLRSDIRLFRKPAATVESEEEAFISKDIFSIAYEAELQNAVALKNFRLAVRLQYLQTLVLLSGKGLLQYKEESTNSDYLMQVYATPYYGPFKKLTRHFEYVWYGQFEVGPDAYRNIETDFTTFKNSMDV